MEYVLFSSGSGETIKTSPDSPLNLQRDESATILSTEGLVQNGFYWQAPIEDGGSDVLDYQVEFLQGNTWVIAAVNVDDTKYANAGLRPSYFYSFRVKARNQHGIGKPS